MANPNPSRITDAQWWLMQQLLTLEPGSENGGIYAFKSGYHSTRLDNQRNWPGDYSIRDAEDQGGPADKAAAFDWTFPTAQAGRYDRIALYMGRICRSADDLNDPRLDGWAEFYGQADGDLQVEGRNTRYGGAITSDSSHLWHIHGSEDRSQVESLDNKKCLISVLRGETVAQWRAGTDQEDIMANADEIERNAYNADVYLWRGLANLDKEIPDIRWQGKETTTIKNQLRARLDEISAHLAEVKARPQVALTDADRAAIVTALSGLVPTAEQIAAAVLDEQARRLES